MGFCGGAGLALTWEGESDKAGGLGLCSWHRAAFEDRLQHFMSGHLFVRSPVKGHILVPESLPEHPLLPVWWPGRFEEVPHPDIEVLAVYERPGEDFWLADLPIASLPLDIFGTWEDVYGFSVTPDYLVEQPCLVHGTYGKGAYTLSYSHLETPASDHANHWLSHLFQVQAGLAPKTDILPPWQLMTQNAVWKDKCLERMVTLMLEVIRTGLEHGLLFQRNDWLLGWRAGIPGAGLNNLWSVLRSIQGLEPTDAAEAYWNDKKELILAAMELFHKGTMQYLLAERLSLTLSKSLPGLISQAMLKEQKDALFGPPMLPKGVYGDILAVLDRLAYLQMRAYF